MNEDSPIHQPSSTSRAGSRPPGAWAPPSLEEMQAMLPQYEFVGLLGRGGMGAVYKAVQISLDRAVAIKVLPGELLDDADANFTERFKNEARLMAKMHHPAIVKVHDFGATQTGLLYFVMEFIDGTDVSKMIIAQGRLPPEHALAITAHVCDALHYAHTHGVIHRDIKPANILINMEGQVKVADFGLAKAGDPNQAGLTQAGMAMGTPDFVAPEAVIDGVQLDGRADIYAVGVMLYQMLTGNIPRGMWTMPSVMVQTDPRFDAIIARAMQPDREARHQSASELRRELDVILTVPYVKHDDRHSSAAIPKQQLALAHQQRQQVVVHRGPQKSAPLAQRQPARVVTYVPQRKPGFLTFVGAVLIGGAGLFVFQKMHKPADAPPQPTVPVTVANIDATPAAQSDGVFAFGGHRYKFLPGPFSKNEDQEAAMDLGGRLAAVTSAEEQQWIEQTFGEAIRASITQRCRIGAAGSRSSWKWLNGEPWSYSNWDTGFPDPNRTDMPILVLNAAGGAPFKWQHAYFGGKAGALVEWDDLSSPIAALPKEREPLSFGGHRYQLVREKLGWQAAEARAEAMGGHLATITTKAEHDWVKAQFGKMMVATRTGSSIWLGALQDRPDAPLRWITGEPFSHIAWNKDEPNNIPGNVPAHVVLAATGGGGSAWIDVPAGSTGISGAEGVLGFLVELDDNLKPAPAPIAAATTTNAVAGDAAGVPMSALTAQLAEASIAKIDDTVVALRVAALQVWHGNHADHAATSQRLLAWAAGTTNPETANRVVKIASLRPLADASLRAAALDMVRACVAAGKGVPNEGWYRLALGMAEFRVDDFRAADATLASAIEIGATHDNPGSRVQIQNTAAFFRAMSLLRQNEPEAARALFSAAEEKMKPAPAAGQNPFAEGGISHDLVINWLAWREAKAALAEPARLTQLDTQFKEVFEREVTNGPAAAAIADLDTKYLAAIDRALADATKAGNADDITSLRAEKQRIADQAPLPSVDPVNITTVLANLRKTYRATLAPLEQKRAAAAALARTRYDQALEAYQKELTQNNALSDALAVKARRDAMRRQHDLETPEAVVTQPPEKSGGASGRD